MIAPLIIGGAMAAGGAAGLFGGHDNKAQQLMQQILAQYNGINVPGVEEQKVILQNLVQQGLVTPEDAATVNLGDTAYNDINLDPQARQAQLGALSQLRDIVSQGGLTATDKWRLQQITDQQETQRRGDEGAIMENARERGVGGSNLELVNRLLANQGAATRANTAGMDVAAQAEQAKLEAIKGVGSLGTDIRGQQYSEAAKKAEAVDAIKKFNAQNKQSQINTNVAARNDAAAKNLTEKQTIADTNTQQGNANTIRNSDLIQQKFTNDLSLAKAKADALAGIAGSEQEKQKQKDQLYASLIGLGGNVISAGRRF